MRTISNVLTIGKDFDLASEGAFEFAKQQGWCKRASDFDFAKAFGNPLYRVTSGGNARRACTYRRLMPPDGKGAGKIGRADFFSALRDHAGHKPEDGWRLQMPCAHASWPATRQSGQTTGSMVSRLSTAGSLHWLTGTSSPCLSLFKPFVLGDGLISTGPAAGEGYDSESLFWRHERLHRLALGDYARRRALIEVERHKLEAAFLSLSNDKLPTANECQQVWETHRMLLPEWSERIARAASTASTALNDRRSWLTRRYWQEQSLMDQLP